MIKKSFLLLTAAVMLFAVTNMTAQEGLKVPVEYYKLDNGLKVVLSQDKSSPIVCVAVYYNIGFRIEPKNRTGFAHLFEHMMFQGSKNLGKMEFIRLVQENGGILNGSTRFDFTNYFEVVPAHKLEPMLWAEADRMSGLSITRENLTNQQGVVINEVKVNVLNQPYGGFPWLDMPQYMNTNWYNAHNFYGDLKDLEAANLEDVKSFFDTYYAPNNAVVVVVGDFEYSDAKAYIEKYFGKIKASDLPAKPDITEPRQEKEKEFSKEDPLANQPAIALAYHMPERNTPEFYAMGIIDQILLQGNDSRLNKKFVLEKGYTDGVYGGINLLGNMFNYNGPMSWMAYLFHDKSLSSETIKSELDALINELVSKPVDKETLDRAVIKIKSEFYDVVGAQFGLGRVDLLACFALFDDKPAKVNEIIAEFEKVTPELIQNTAKEYLRSSNRTVLKIEPKKEG